MNKKNILAWTKFINNELHILCFGCDNLLFKIPIKEIKKEWAIPNCPKCIDA